MKTCSTCKALQAQLDAVASSDWQLTALYWRDEAQHARNLLKAQQESAQQDCACPPLLRCAECLTNTLYAS